MTENREITRTTESEKTLGFDEVKNQLAEFANTLQAKEQIAKLEPYLEERELRKNMRETTQARKMFDALGLPPVPAMDRLEEFVNRAVAGELILPEEMESVGSFLQSVKRLKDYLERGIPFQISLAYYSENLVLLEELQEEIAQSIRNGRVDEYASSALHNVRKKIQQAEEKIKTKAEAVLKANKKAMSDQFVVTRSGHICVPVKRNYKSQVPGSVIDQSATGTTLFIEPKSVKVLGEELELLRIEEDSEERRILYTILDHIAMDEAMFRENIKLIVKLDFIFAKGKFSDALKAVEPEICRERQIIIRKGRHPQLDPKTCVPLDFCMKEETRGIVITGPNTGGKTVSIKTVGIFAMMAGAGLHVPCESAQICMFNQVLSDIGDGQNITDNLSTFSAHIKNVIHILERVSEESLVILDELGSGTDPLEGMGIAIAILEKLRQCGCRFLVTTHYPEVKEFANRYPEILNARMAFDREQLRPLYQLEIGSAGESCALYIAKKLGLPEDVLRIAATEAYGTDHTRLEQELGIAAEHARLEQELGIAADHTRLEQELEIAEDHTRLEQELEIAEDQIRLEQEFGIAADHTQIEHELVIDEGTRIKNNCRGKVRSVELNTKIPRLIFEKEKSTQMIWESTFSRGDSVFVSPDGKIGIVVKPEDDQGNVLVQIQKEKVLINQKRLKLKVAASELYPEDYDFSIIFDSVEARKDRHKLGKGYQKDLMVEAETWK